MKNFSKLSIIFLALFIIFPLKSNAAEITCGGSRCTAYECCDSSNTGNLPEINIWPIYKGQV